MLGQKPIKQLAAAGVLLLLIACGRTGLDEEEKVRSIPTPDTRIVDDGGIYGYEVGEYASFKFDRMNVPHISYYDRTNGNLKYATLDVNEQNRPWRLEVADTGMVGETEFDVGKYTSLAIDPFGQPHISYYDVSNGRLKYAARISGQWQVFVIDPGGGSAGVGTWSSLALDNNGVAHISYIDENQQSLFHATFNAFYPEIPPAIDFVDKGVGGADAAGAGGTLGPGTDIALFNGPVAQYPIISYYDSANGQVKVATYNTTTLSWDLDMVYYFAINEKLTVSITPPHVATVKHDIYQDYGSTIIYGHNYRLKNDEYQFEGTRNIIINNTTWDMVTRNYAENPAAVDWNISYLRADVTGAVPTIANVGKWNSLYIDEANRLHLSYQDETHEDLRYAQFDGNVWILEVVAREGNVGAHSSVTVAGPFDYPQLRQPVISFFDSTNNDLMIAFRRAPSRWDVYRLDTAFMSGTWTSIDTIADGMGVGVAYHDPFKNWLKFAFVNYF